MILDPRFPELRVHFSLYESLGVAGMSSDEEAPGPQKGPRQFMSFRKHYLAMAVSELGYHLDDLHNRFFEAKDFVRFRSELPARTNALIACLPWNAYDGNWSRYWASPNEKAFVRPSPIAHPFVHHVPAI